MPLSNAQLAQAVSDLIASDSAIKVEFQDWLNGTIAGGPNSDGRYPLTDYQGNTELYECPAKMGDNVSNNVSGALAYANAASAAQTAAEAAQAAAELAETNSQTNETGAIVAKDAALSAQTAAESARTTSIAQAGVATTNAGYSQEWAITVEDTLVSVAAGGNGTTDYSSLHHAAKAAADAVAAAASAAAALVSETNAAASEAAAATFNPVLYAALADNETVTGQYTFSHASGILIGAAPLTAALIGQWNTAYGWGDHAGLYSLAAHNHAGVYEPADATILKDADIGVTVAAFAHNHAGVYEPVDASLVRSGTYTQEDNHTYLNRNDPANPVFRVAQVGAGPIAHFGKVPTLGSVGYTASVEIRANAVTVLDTAGDDYTYRMARSGVISGGFYHDATTQYWLNSAGNWFVKNDYGTVNASFAGSVNALGLNITGNADITGSLDVLDAAGGNSHFNYGVGQNYLSHLTGNFTRFRSFDGVSTYTDIAEFSDDGLKITSTTGSGNMLHLHGTSPQIYLQDTDASSHDFWFHVNSNNLYILNDTNDSGSWSSPYPMQIESDTQNVYFFGHDNVTANLDGQSYFGIHINGADNGWIRATTPGFLPHTSGGGSSSLGTTSWPWTNIVGQAIEVVGTNSNFSSFSQANVVFCPQAAPGTNGIHMYPVLRGAAYRGTGPVTGYCRIRYPTGMTNDSTMHSFIIRGYNYSSALDGDGGGWAIEVGGYKYSSENWLNNTAHIIYGSPPFDRVHFGEDETGDYAYVLLGSSTTQWDYPQIYISDLMAGYGSYLHDIGSGFWLIDISASTPTNWSQDAGTGTAYIGGQIRWEGDPGSSIAAGKNLGGRCVISTSTASGGQDGDIWYQY